MANMKDVPPLTAELIEHLAALVEMLENTLAVLHDYAAQHPNRLHHLSEEASLLCQNLLKHLEHLRERDETLHHRECHDILTSMLSDGDELETMGKRLHQDGADDRLCHALEILAESFRLAGPAILRWCHGSRSPLAGTALDKCRHRFQQTIEPLEHELATA